MDDAAGRVELRGLRVLRRCRELRGEAAAREAGRCREAAEGAAAEAGRAKARLRAHVQSWRGQEKALMGAAPDAPIPAHRLDGRRRHLERLADEAVRLVDAMEAAEEASARAAAALDAARAVLALRRREESKTVELVGRAAQRACRAAVAAEQREAEDDATDRLASSPTARGGRGTAP